MISPPVDDRILGPKAIKLSMMPSRTTLVNKPVFNRTATSKGRPAAQRYSRNTLQQADAERSNQYHKKLTADEMSTSIFTRLRPVMRFLSSRAYPPMPQPPAEPPRATMPIPEWPKDARGEAMRTAKARRLGINVSPRKLNLVARLVRGMSVEHAHRQLAGCTKKTAPIVAQVLDAAVTNAKAYGLKLDRLVVNEAFVGKGHYLKRVRPWHGKGRFGIEHKKYSHLTVIVRECDEELWELKVLPQYVHMRRGGDGQHDASHPIHKSETVSWVSDIDKGIAQAHKSIEGLKNALETQLKEQTPQQVPSTASKK